MAKKRKPRPKPVQTPNKPDNPPNLDISPILAISNKDSKFKRFIKSTWGVITIFSTIFGLLGIGGIQIYNTYVLSARENYANENFVKGIFLPPDLLEQEGSIEFIIGGMTIVCPIDSLRDVIAYPVNQMFPCKTDKHPFKLGIGIKNNRLVVTTSFKDIQKHELVGSIYENEWTLFKGNLLDFYEDEKNLEVSDRSGNMIFSLSFEKPNRLYYQGYFVGEDNIFAASILRHKACIDNNDMATAMMIINEIAPLPHSREMEKPLLDYLIVKLFFTYFIF